MRVAARIAGFADLYEAIEKGDFPRWTVQVQVMT